MKLGYIVAYLAGLGTAYAADHIARSILDRAEREELDRLDAEACADSQTDGERVTSQLIRERTGGDLREWAATLTADSRTDGADRIPPRGPSGSYTPPGFGARYRQSDHDALVSNGTRVIGTPCYCPLHLDHVVM